MRRSARSGGDVWRIPGKATCAAVCFQKDLLTVLMGTSTVVPDIDESSPIDAQYPILPDVLMRNLICQKCSNRSHSS